MKTLKDACKAYIQHLGDTGSKDTTVSNYRSILQLFIRHQGENKDITKIMPVHVSSYYKSDPVNFKVNPQGEKSPRAKLSVDRNRRVVRMALVWWFEKGWISSVPLPSDEKRFLSQKPEKAKKRPQKALRRKTPSPTPVSKRKAPQRASGCEKRVSANSPGANSGTVKVEVASGVSPVAVSEPDTDHVEVKAGTGSQDNDLGENLMLL